MIQIDKMSARQNQPLAIPTWRIEILDPADLADSHCGCRQPPNVMLLSRIELPLAEVVAKQH
jgi:hypothetical protein